MLQIVILFVHIFFMEEICNRLQILGEKNGTGNLVDDTMEFIQNNLNKFQSDYNNTSRKLRLSTGKLEASLFQQLAAICQYENGNDNAKIASEIMVQIGYNSYAERPNRFRQKVENYKKTIKQGKKRGKHFKSKRLRRSQIVKDYCSSCNSDYSDQSIDYDSGDQQNDVADTIVISRDPIPVSKVAGDMGVIDSPVSDSLFADIDTTESSWRRLDNDELDRIIAQQLGYYTDNKNTFLESDFDILDCSDDIVFSDCTFNMF